MLYLNAGIHFQKTIQEKVIKNQNKIEKGISKGSQQLQGEAKELVIEEWLENEFPIDNIIEIKPIDQKDVAGIKLFLGSSTGKMLIDDKSSIENIFNSTLLPISAHCEDEQIIKDNTEHYKNLYGENIPISAHPEIRNEKACFKSSSFAVNLARKTGARLNVFHISTAIELDLFDNSTDLKNKKITSEVCAHHLWFTDEHDSMKIKTKRYFFIC